MAGVAKKPSCNNKIYVEEARLPWACRKFYTLATIIPILVIYNAAALNGIVCIQ